ncbi:MAG TPA: SpvB/TcaC N-terminal domain-containing protein [Nitrospira sp.]|nr:SpvB/TcaC N-terminal domain-containing protein [Nitrospira sp.]
MAELKRESSDGNSAEKSFQVSAPAITLPKGGGAIRGIGEKFAANPVTGTGSMTVPIATSPGRSGFGPQLSLSYDSGAGNSPFGFGWSLSLPSITRRTEKGLPQYLDAKESDVFILSGAEDLVPVLVQDANKHWAREELPDRTIDAKTYRIRRYRPRIEGLFASIERWTNINDATDVFWRSISKDNITTWYGRSPDSRIADPSDTNRIFSWLICQSHDDKGNVIVYGYKTEDSTNVFQDSSQKSLGKAHERYRSDQTRSAQRYLKHIRYGNGSPYFPVLKSDAVWPEPPDAHVPDGSNVWHFEVVFDYGEHDAKAPTPNDAGSWPARPDPFSSYRAGFEVRTYRICQRVLMFHHFPDEAGVGRDCLVRSTDFMYSNEVDHTDGRNPVYTFLTAVTHTGYRRTNGSYDKGSLPPVEFEYTKPIVQETVEVMDSENLKNLPIGVDGTAYQWTDLHGEGIPGILTEQAGTWFYKRNLSPISKRPGEFSPMECVALKPNLALAGGAQFMDLAGDGLPDVVVLDGPMSGLYEHDKGEGWQPFRFFTARLSRDMRDPNLKFVDLDGDGHADILISEDEAFVWHSSLAEDGFGPALRIAQALDEEKGPRIVFGDGTQSIYLADLSGDGLTDIVRIRNGEVCYWPNLGYGRFGAKVMMDNAPWFDNPDQFDHKRIRLADIDGSGTTDIIYLHRDGVRLFFNQSGNSWSQPYHLKVFPRIDDPVNILPTDLLGNGTACLVWSSPLPGDAGRPMRYVNLMGKQKPHLLIKTVNNLGAEIRVHFAPSTKFYLQDKRDGQPWITRLPFPVHVVERVETYDHISRNRFVSRYAYHHGYFDGEEREFRGFGMVEQWDTEQIGALIASGVFPQSDNIAATSHVPPVHTKTWFHTGGYEGTDEVSQHFAREYYGAPEKNAQNYKALFDAYFQTLLPDTVIPSGLTLEEEREACRALKGSMLRQEVYANDADHPGATLEQIQRARIPYTVTEQNFTIQPLQPRGVNPHAVFFTHAREAISYHYERNTADPRIQHALTLEVDDFGNVLKQAAIGYGRRVSPPAEQWDRDRQTTPLLTYTESRVTNAIKTPDAHRTPLPCEAITYELTGYTPTRIAGRYRASDFVEPDPALPARLQLKFTDEVAYEAPATGNPCRRPIEWLRTLYRSDNLSVLLPLEGLQPLALPGESYKLAFTPGLIAQVYQRNSAVLIPDPLQVFPVDRAPSLSGDRGGYVDLDSNGHWWIPSGRSFYHSNEVSAPVELTEAQAHFFQPRRYRDPFGQNSLIDFDGYDLLVKESRDALGNRFTVDTNDYRVLQPRLVSDPNRNQTEVAFDVLGMVVGTAVMGKPLPAPVEGDSLTGFVADLTQTQLDGFFAVADPHATASALLQDATTRIVYDLDRFRRTQRAYPNDPQLWQPSCGATLTRETHVSDLAPNQESKLQVTFSYSDGFGREIQKKIQAEPDQGRFAVDVLEDRPIAYYRLNDSAESTRILDQSGNGHHGECSPTGITLQQAGLGVDDAAILSDGQGSGRVVVPDSEQLNPKWITIEALINWFGPTGSQQRILEKSYSAGSPTWPTYGLSILENGTVRLELVITGHSDPVLVTSKVKVSAHVPTHVAATFDGQTIQIYVNGVLDTSWSVVGSIVSTFGSSKLGIGNQVERNRQFNGLLDEVVLYDQALAPGRIQSHVAKVKTGNLPRRRWVGSGWTIFNNKGKPVRQYEPFFSTTHRFEFGTKVGVSPVLFYDPAGRVMATLHPNNTYEKVVFDSWQQTAYDVNDTCAPRNQQTGDPRTDPDIVGYVAEYFKTQPATWQTWHAHRIGGDLGQHERNAALGAAAHADTPTTAHFDALGRHFLTVARNRIICPGHDLDGTEENFATRVELDTEGNQCAVRDAMVQDGDPFGRIVMRYTYDMLGNRIHQLSMEAGARWMLNDVASKPIRAWDSRGHNFTMSYDALRRPISQYVLGNTAESDPRTLNPPNAIGLLVDRIEYGEPPANATEAQKREAQRLNQCTRIYRHFDPAGIAVSARLNVDGHPTEAYDFKGNLLRTTRQLVSLYEKIPDWSQNLQLDSERFESSSRYDALNRPVQSIASISSERRGNFKVIQQVFNEANLLERVDVWMERATEPSALLDPSVDAPTPVGVANIDYDAKGQRMLIAYKTRDAKVIQTTYSYDRETFRLMHLYTRRGVDPKTARGVSFSEDCDNPQPPPPTIAAPDKPPQGKACGLQNLHYTYDPAGNITHIQDDAQQTIYFKNQRVEPSNDYVYDAMYRLIEASGREHLGQTAGITNPPTHHSHNDVPRIRRPHPNELDAMGAYLERYVYDAVGNLESMQHQGLDPANPGWTRTYTYKERSQIESRKRSNRLTSTTIGNSNPVIEEYQHDAHGNMLGMLQLQVMQWDYKDQLQMTQRQKVNEEDAEGEEPHGERTWYVYDAAGKRSRKVTELANNGGLKEERIYLGGFEIYRRHSGPDSGLVRESLHIMDDKQRIALVETRNDVDDGTLKQVTRYQFGNHLGSASLEVNEQAQVISYEEYAPYGSTSYQAVRGQTETAKRYRYTSKERDEESGLYCFGARPYACWLGRFMRSDPIGIRGGLNQFAYAAANPLRNVDPTGKAPQPAQKPQTGNHRDNTLDYDRLEREMHLKAAALEGAMTTQSIVTEHETLVKTTGKGKYFGSKSHFAKDPKSDRSNLEECNCILYQMKPVDAYIQNLEAVGEVPKGTWDLIRSVTEDSDRRDTVLMEQLRVNAGFRTLLVDRGEMVGKYTLSRAVERASGLYPPKSDPVTGLDSGAPLDVRTHIDVTFKNTKKDRTKALEYLSSLPFAIVTEDYGNHTLVLSFGVVYEAHWAAEPTEQDQGKPDPMFERTSLDIYMKTHKNLVFAVPPDSK